MYKMTLQPTESPGQGLIVFFVWICLELSSHLICKGFWWILNYYNFWKSSSKDIEVLYSFHVYKHNIHGKAGAPFSVLALFFAVSELVQWQEFCFPALHSFRGHDFSKEGPVLGWTPEWELPRPTATWGSNPILCCCEPPALWRKTNVFKCKKAVMWPWQ